MYDFSQPFNINGINPEQSAGSNHPVGRYPAMISGTELKPTKDGDGGFLVIEFSTPQGKIVKRLNLWNNNTQAVEIAVKELAAIGYATGIHTFAPLLQNAARELMNARCQIEVKVQAKNPNYTEVAFIYDVNGVDPKEIAAGRGGQQGGGQQGGGQQGQTGNPFGNSGGSAGATGTTGGNAGSSGGAWPNAGSNAQGGNAGPFGNGGQSGGTQGGQTGNPFGGNGGQQGNGGGNAGNTGGNPFQQNPTVGGAPWANRT